MKRFSTIALVIVLSLLTAFLMPAQVFADSQVEYVSEVKVFMGSCTDAEKEGFKILSDDNGNPIDLNQKAGGGWGSKGEKAVYLGYKTTTDEKDAITDLALMNMKGGYDTAEYDILMSQQMSSQIVPFIENFMVAIDEYRVNYDPEFDGNKQRADYINTALNKLRDDDCQNAGLGDLLLNETIYEMAKPKYDALSDAEKEKTSLYDVNKQVRDSLPESERNKHADILTIIAQANGQATLLLENLLVRACDTNETNWVERFSKLTYDDLIDSTGLAPTDARKQIAKLYDDDANKILDMWDAFREQLLKADETAEKLEEFDPDKMDQNADVLDNFDLETATDDDLDALAEASVEVETDSEILSNRLADVVAKEYLLSVDYEDGTLYDFFTQEYDEVADNIEMLYPIVASLSPGQRAGLEFITLSTLVIIAGTDDSYYSDEEIDKLEVMSIYDGVDRAIYQTGGVALTSDALRKDAANRALGESQSKFPINWWTFLSGGLALASVTAFVSTFAYARRLASLIKGCEASIASAQSQIAAYSDMATKYAASASKLIGKNGFTFTEYNRIFYHIQSERDVYTAFYKSQIKSAESEMARLSARSSMCNKLMIGLGVAMIILTAVTVYLSWQDMKNYYKVDFTPIPHYMIEAKDLIGYNSKGEQIILKNQTAYYKAVECNRTSSAEFYKTLGTCADMNGDVGKQWLALYSVKNELMDPIIASSLKAVTDSVEIPSGYEKGIHMFGSTAAFNLNSNLYDWNDSAKSTFIYFKTDSSKTTNTTASNFTGGSVAVVGGAGIAVGALAMALGIRSKRKNEPEMV